MTGTIAIALIAAVWIFMLAPWILRSHKPISKAGEAFDETRVIHEGGTSALTVRKRPRPGPLDGSTLYDATIDEPLSIDETEPEIADVIPDIEDDAYFIDDDDIDETVPYDIDDAYITPEDLLYPTDDTLTPLEETGEYETFSPETDDEELTDEELQYAAARKGRGGYDPEADRSYANDRYQRRQRTVITLGVIVVVTTIAALVLGNLVWIAPAIAVAITTLYLIALRSQVKAEEQLRHRRIQQLRRSRLGVRNASDHELGIPQRLRRPGAVVLEIDDESPDFVHLDVIDAKHYLTDDEYNSGYENLRVS
ncbi:hypothetical protein CMUST_05040 [Corynebacterium mustelae]|uniref:Uncharacterized protein n=1 Tax=Corynebacterium mustelae TaxID=571915 RepID=A0A0G3GVY8_9CORY|nr:gephyrin-like molybdotransferase receptor GlpR [Corynebacterium mustelae]AKK05346.1 hypothetical protein CMUST_05040 [Corynebacterium mustelae]